MSETYGRAARVRGDTAWSDVAPPDLEFEDRLSADAALDIWNRIYPMFQASGEAAHKEVRLAVYAYYAANGASRRTLHGRDITTGGGINVIAADVRDVIGEDRIRKFLRSDVDEVYSALKETGTLERNEVFVAKAMSKGVPRGFMHCAVDFLAGCSLLTPEEKIYHDRHFEYSITRARAARGNLTVDDEDRRTRGRHLAAQREQSRVGDGNGAMAVNAASDEF